MDKIGPIESFDTFIQMIDDRSDLIEKPQALLQFLNKNPGHVETALTSDKASKLLTDRVAELSKDDLQNSRTRKHFQKILSRVPALHQATADRHVSIGKHRLPIHSALVGAQDAALSDLMEDTDESQDIFLMSDSSEAAQQAYVELLEHGGDVPPEHHLEILVLASRDGNMHLANRLWRGLRAEHGDLGPLAGAWIEQHLHDRDPLGALVERINDLKQLLHEGRSQATPTKGQLYRAMIDDDDGYIAFQNDWQNEEEPYSPLTDEELAVARWVVHCTDGECMTEMDQSNGVQRKLLKDRLKAEPKICDPIVADAGTARVEFYPALAASHCQHLNLVAIDDGPACWLSKDIERYPLDLQVAVLEALRGLKSVRLRSADFDAWKVLDLAEMHGITELIDVARKRIVQEMPPGDLANVILQGGSENPVADCIRSGVRLGILRDFQQSLISHCQGMDAEQLTEALTPCLKMLKPDQLKEPGVCSAVQKLIEALPTDAERCQATAKLLSELESHFVPQLFLSLINAATSGAQARAEQVFEATLQDPNADIPDTTKEGAYDAVMALLSREEAVATQQLIDDVCQAAAEHGGIPDSLQMWVDARRMGLEVGYAGLTSNMRIRLDAQEASKIDMRLCARLRERFQCTALELASMSLNSWQTLDMRAHLESSPEYVIVNIAAAGRVDDEIYQDLARAMKEMPKLQSLSIHGPRDSRGFYAERIDMVSIRRVTQAMIEHPTLAFLSLDLRDEDAKDDLARFAQDKLAGVLSSGWGGGGASIEFRRRERF